MHTPSSQVQTAPASKSDIKTESGRQKAKDAVAKEKEKALLKKQQREKDQQDRLAAKEKAKELRQQDVENDLANAGALAVVTSTPTAVDSDRKVAVLATTEAEQAAAAVAATADAAAAAAALAAKQTHGRPIGPVAEKPSAGGARVPKQLDEAMVKQLFSMLDRSEKGSISKRDVLIALRKHAPVRVFFGLPAGSTGDGGDDLQARLNAIQDSFEASSGLGELGSTFEELSKADGGSGQTFAWDSFLPHCQKDAVRGRVAEALCLMPREHTVGAPFQATYEWKIVLEGAACEAGLEYKMDMASGKTLGRLPRPKAK